MLPALLCLVLAPQVIDGRKPVIDGTIPFVKAFGKLIAEDATATSKPDMFLIGYFSMRAKTLLPLLNTKYTASHVGICGTILGAYDPEVVKPIKAAADRITQGSKDYDSFTSAERDAIGKAMVREGSPVDPLAVGSASGLWEYFAGAHLGALSAYTTYWHVSPTNEHLVNGISGALVACRAQAAKAEASGRPEVRDALKAMPLPSAPYDEAKMRMIATQIEATLKAATHAKYRW